MFDGFLSQMLIVFLLTVISARFFFTKNAKIDSCAILAPITFALSLVNIFLWNLTETNLILAIFSLIVFATNFRALIRLSANLFIDRYSPFFCIFSTLELIFTVLLAIFLVLNRPVKAVPKDFASTKTICRLSGNVSRGFTPLLAKDFFYKSTGTLKIFAPASTKDTESAPAPTSASEPAAEPAAPEQETAPNSAAPQKKNTPLLLFCGNGTAETADYEPYLLFLSKKGYTVLAADFYADDCLYLPGIYNSRFLRKFLLLKDKDFLKKTQSSATKLNQVNSYKALTKLAGELYGADTPLFFVFDSLDFDSISEITENAAPQSQGFFSLNSIPEYKTPNLGFIEQTNIRLAKKQGLSRDPSLFIPRYLANKTEEQIQLLTNP